MQSDQPAPSRLLSIVAHNGSGILGGGEIGTALLLQGLQARGHRVLMLMRNTDLAERVAVYGIPVGVQRVGGDVMFPHALTLSLRLRRERPDAVILTTFKKVLLAGLAARMASAPFTVQRIVLQGDTPARGARYRFALRHLVDAVVLNADAMRVPFLAGDPQLAPRLLTILDGVRAPQRQRPAGLLRLELGIPAEAFVIGSVGRLARQKRFDRLLQALKLLHPSVHCIIVGEGEELDVLRALAGELGLEKRVHLPGFRSDVGDVLSALDLFVVSSDREGLANAMLEAMMAGIAVVSTDVSGAREAIVRTSRDPAAGVVTGFDARELAQAIESLHEDRERLRELGAAARLRAEQRFGAERFLDDWERLLLDGAAQVRR